MSVFSPSSDLTHRIPPILLRDRLSPNKFPHIYVCTSWSCPALPGPHWPRFARQSLPPPQPFTPHPHPHPTPIPQKSFKKIFPLQMFMVKGAQMLLDTLPIFWAGPFLLVWDLFVMSKMMWVKFSFFSLIKAVKMTGKYF